MESIFYSVCTSLYTWVYILLSNKGTHRCAKVIKSLTWFGNNQGSCTWCTSCRISLSYLLFCLYIEGGRIFWNIRGPKIFIIGLVGNYSIVEPKTYYYPDLPFVKIILYFNICLLYSCSIIASLMSR